MTTLLAVKTDGQAAHAMGSTTRLRKPQAYHHGDLRAELLKVARQRLASEGYEALSLRGLARETGVAASAFYAHFNSRNELFEALILEGAQTLARRFDAAAALAGGAEVRLGAACRAYLNFAQRNGEMFRLIFTAPVLRSPVFESEVSATLAQFEKMVAATQGADKLLTTRQVTLACWSLMHGFAMLRLHRRLQVSMANEDSKELIVSAVLRLARRKS